MTAETQQAIRGIVGDGVKFAHDAIERGGITRHTVVLTETLDPKTERPIVGSGPSPEDAARKAAEKIPQP